MKDIINNNMCCYYSRQRHHSCPCSLLSYSSTVIFFSSYKLAPLIWNITSLVCSSFSHSTAIRTMVIIHFYTHTHSLLGVNFGISIQWHWTLFPILCSGFLLRIQESHTDHMHRYIHFTEYVTASGVSTTAQKKRFLKIYNAINLSHELCWPKHCC